MSTSEVKFRLFKPGDLGAVIAINRRELPENYSPSFFYELYRDYPNTFIVAEVDGNVVGYIMCRMEHVPMLTGFKKRGHVVSIAVLREYQRRGIGSTLMRKAMEGMKSYGAEECYLEVRVSNERAIRMYKKLGLSFIDRIRHYYLDGEDAYVMAGKIP